MLSEVAEMMAIFLPDDEGQGKKLAATYLECSSSD